MIFHRCDADAQQFVYLAITEFVHPVHQENAARFWRHGVNRRFIQSQQVRGFEVPLLRRRRRAVALLAKRKEDRPRGLLAPRAIDKEILGDAAKKPARIDELVALCAPRSEEHTSELQSLMRISYAVFCLNTTIIHRYYYYQQLFIEPLTS